MEIQWEKWDAVDNAASDLQALFETWGKIGGAGCDGDLDGYLYGAAYGHVQELYEAIRGTAPAAMEAAKAEVGTPKTEYATPEKNCLSLIYAKDTLGGLIQNSDRSDKVMGELCLIFEALERVCDDMDRAQNKSQRTWTDLGSIDPKIPPAVTVGKLAGWQDRIKIVSTLAYSANETVELLNSEEREATDFLGPLSLVKNALDKVEDELSALCMDIGDAKAGQAEPEAAQ